MNNFFGVKYLFVQSNGDNATKIPAGYFLDKATDPVINYDEGQPSNPKARMSLCPRKRCGIKRTMTPITLLAR